jgi:hypothetical protein
VKRADLRDILKWNNRIQARVERWISHFLNLQAAYPSCTTGLETVRTCCNSVISNTQMNSAGLCIVKRLSWDGYFLQKDSYLSVRLISRTERVGSFLHLQARQHGFVWQHRRRNRASIACMTPKNSPFKLEAWWYFSSWYHYEYHQ